MLPLLWTARLIARSSIGFGIGRGGPWPRPSGRGAGAGREGRGGQGLQRYRKRPVSFVMPLMAAKPPGGAEAALWPGRRD